MTGKLYSDFVPLPYEKIQGGLWVQRAADDTKYVGALQTTLQKPALQYERVIPSLFISFCVIVGIWFLCLLAVTEGFSNIEKSLIYH